MLVYAALAWRVSRAPVRRSQLVSCQPIPAGERPNRVKPTVEWWRKADAIAGTRVVDEAARTTELSVYDISALGPGEPLIQLEEPADLPDQPSDCSSETGSRGASVFAETVTLGSSLSVGASKRGTRNIIPIAGGTVTGRLTGSVLPGGGDYQLIGSVAVLDASYALHTDDDEFVLVRNCGPMGALVPLFEARADGTYAFLNAENLPRVIRDERGASRWDIRFPQRQHLRELRAGRRRRWRKHHVLRAPVARGVGGWPARSAPPGRFADRGEPYLPCPVEKSRSGGGGAPLLAEVGQWEIRCTVRPRLPPKARGPRPLAHHPCPPTPLRLRRLHFAPGGQREK